MIDIDCQTLTWILAALAVNAIAGLACIEWAWKQVKPLRDGNEELHQKYYAFRRLDTHKWKKWKFQLGAATLMFTRLFLFVLTVIFAALIVRIITIGVTVSEDRPLTGWRNEVTNFVIRAGSTIVVFAAGFTSQMVDKDFDYSYYLGSDYKQKNPIPKYVPTCIANHHGLIDVLLIIKHLKPAFAAKKRVKRIPIFGLLVQALGCIFIKRSGTVEQREQSIQTICDRQQQIQETGQYPQICIFPEGGAHNGSHLMNFKRGAFTSLRPITPLVVKLQHGIFRPTFDVISFLPYLFMQMSAFNFHCEITRLPPFVPNEFLFENHKDKVLKSSPNGPTAPEKWEVYAWALRDVMSKAGNLPLSNDQTQAGRLDYKGLTGFKSEKYIKKD